jgi:hypothetical protein
MTVEVDQDGLVAAMVTAGWSDFLWEFQVDSRRAGPPVDAALAMTEVVDVVNAIYDPEGGGDGPTSEEAVETSLGTVARFYPVGSVEEVRGWFNDVSVRLAERAWEGRIGPARPDPRPAWVHDSVDRRKTALTAVLSLGQRSAATHGQGTVWGVSGDTTAEVVEVLINWLLNGEGGHVVLTRATFAEEIDDTAGLTAAVQRSVEDLVGVSVANFGSGGVARVLSFGMFGAVTLQVAGRREDWRRQFGALMAVVPKVAAHVDLGAIRRATLLAHGWYGVSFDPPAAPLPLPARFGTVEAHIEQRPGLSRTHVVDAYGVQVLSKEHLAALPDLAASGRWIVESVGHGRALVIARDVASWFEDDVPASSVLDQARNDFEGLLARRAELSPPN